VTEPMHGTNIFSWVTQEEKNLQVGFIYGRQVVDSAIRILYDFDEDRKKIKL